MKNDRGMVLVASKPYTSCVRSAAMRSRKKMQAQDCAEDLEEISVVENLLELQSRLKSKTDSMENPSG